MKIFTFNYLSRIIVYLFFTIVIFFIGVVTEPDTLSYVGLSVITPPGYGTFLFVFRKVFGEENYFTYVLVAQGFICFLSCWYFSKVLDENFRINKRLLVLVDIILLAPILIPEYLIVNRIVTQGLAYPLFLVVIAFFIQGVFKKKKAFFILFILALVTIILVRTQFLFALPVFLLVLGYFWIMTKKHKLFGFLVLAIMIVPLVVSFTQKSFNYLVHDRYVNISSTGLQVMIMPLFVADADDYKLYKDTKTQNYYQYVYQEAVNMQLLDDFYIPSNDNVFHAFDYNYIFISYEILSKKGRVYLFPDDPDSIDSLIKNDKFLMTMWMPLLLDNFWKCVDLYYKNVEHAFGGFYMIWLCLLVLLFSMYIWRKYNNNLALFSCFLMLLTFSNILIICLVQHSIGRYLIYHQWMLPILLVLWFNEQFVKLKY
ncbi:hypothetical protein [Aquimarina addita]